VTGIDGMAQRLEVDPERARSPGDRCQAEREPDPELDDDQPQD
jgi:hypothetical protein